VMNPVALKTAQKVGFPADHIVGNVWSNSEEDVTPAGDAAKGYVAITTQASGAQYPVLQEIVKTVYGAGKGNLEDKNRIGSVYHNLGIVNGILNVEAVRTAQEKFGHRTLTGDEVRWGFEHLKLDPARVEALGAKNLFHSINVTWDNHEGDGYVTFQQWDGKKWNVVSDWIAPDWALLRPIIEKSATAYATEHNIQLRTAADAERVDTKPYVANK
jgi:branched-chain amino acid transport system substrate-binding protein